jgi:hypothetical protein
MSREIESGGRDDQQYVLLMEQYKLHRRKDGWGALKYLDAAIALAETGEVSQDAQLGGAYV